MAETILIAEDDRDLLRALTIRFESEGYQVIATRDAYLALEFARRREPDVLLLDIHLPAGDGFSVQQRLAQIERLRDTPVVYMTGETSDRVDRHAQAIGAFALVHKPFETDRMVETIRAAIDCGAPVTAAG